MIPSTSTHSGILQLAIARRPPPLFQHHHPLSGARLDNSSAPNLAKFPIVDSLEEIARTLGRACIVPPATKGAHGGRSRSGGSGQDDILLRAMDAHRLVADALYCFNVVPGPGRATMTTRRPLMRTLTMSHELGRRSRLWRRTD